MKEVKSKKEWIKTFAIIFLAVLLVLTFFSNTIQNYSLPEVAAQYTNSGTITNKVRGQGTVESADPYSVVYNESRKIESVAVKVGDEVTKGDTLYVLEEGDSEELKAATAELRSLQDAYEKAIISGQISSKVTNSVEEGTTGTLAERQKKIEAAKKKVESCQAVVDSLQSQKDMFQSGTATYVQEKKDLEDLKKQLAEWTEQDAANAKTLAPASAEYTDAKAVTDEAWSKYDVSANEIPPTATQSELDSLKADYENAKAISDAKEAAYKKEKEKKDNSESHVNYYTALIANQEKIIDDRSFEYTYQIGVAQDNLDKAKKELDELIGTISSEIDLSSQLDAIKKQEETVEKLKETQGSLAVTAPVSGTVLSMSYVAGETIVKGETVSTIQIAGKGYTLSMSVTNEQASLIGVGDEAEVTNSWWYSDVKARITSIRPDPSNPASGKKVTFEVEGDVSNGQTLSLTVGRRSANYDNIVPNSAIREDNNGKFVYRINSKSTPLGTRYILERVDIKVLASDETQSAISGALEGWDYVVTTSSKPLSDGQQVRLKD